jgi:hypothetical protein
VWWWWWWWGRWAPITDLITALLVLTQPLLPSAAQACLQWEPLVNPMTAGMAGGTAPMPASATVNLTTLPADCWFNLLQVRRHAGTDLSNILRLIECIVCLSVSVLEQHTGFMPASAQCPAHTTCCPGQDQWLNPCAWHLPGVPVPPGLPGPCCLSLLWPTSRGRPSPPT